MRRPRTLSAFTEPEREKVHHLLATKVAFMMGRKLEEGDWADVYCTAKGIPIAAWSNLQIDVMHESLGVEHKMLCRKSGRDIAEDCGVTMMHPSATRSIRVPSTDTDPNDAMRQVLSQYGDLIRRRSENVRERSESKADPDMRTGWLLWQESLRQFLYFEEEMFIPDPEDYFAEWKTTDEAKSRKKSTSLWIFEKETKKKRYSVTTEAGAKIQPYFDVPPPSDPNIYIFTVIGEVIDAGLVRIWLTEATARDLSSLLGSLDTDTVSTAVLRAVTQIPKNEEAHETDVQVAISINISSEAYLALRDALPNSRSDEHSFQRLAQYLKHPV